MQKISAKKAVTQTTEEYANQSSIHGVGYIFDTQLSIFDRFLWFFLVVVFAGVAAALAWNFWSQWRSEQVKKLVRERFQNKNGHLK